MRQSPDIALSVPPLIKGRIQLPDYPKHGIYSKGGYAKLQDGYG